MNISVDVLEESEYYLKCPLNQRSPAFLASGTGFMKDNFSMDQGRGDGFRMIQVHYIYYVLYFSFYYFSATSDHQTLDP